MTQLVTKHNVESRGHNETTYLYIFIVYLSFSRLREFEYLEEESPGHQSGVERPSNVLYRLDPPTLTLCTGVRGPCVRGVDISGWREPAVSLTADTHCKLHTADCRHSQRTSLNSGVLTRACSL